MQKLEIELTDNEKLELQYRIYEFNGMQVAMNQFILTDKNFNEEHYNRLVNTYIEKYRARQECLYRILKNHGYNVSVKEYDVKADDNILTVWV